MLLGSLLLAALAVFIVWESWGWRGSASQRLAKGQVTGAFVPGGGAKWKLWFVLATVFALLGLTALLEPKHPPFMGRWSWFESALYAHLGPSGIGILLLLLAVAMLLAGVLLKRRVSA